jgi:hypothetical protein
MSLVDTKSIEKSSRLESVPVIQRLDETLVNRIAAGEVRNSIMSSTASTMVSANLQTNCSRSVCSADYS